MHKNGKTHSKFVKLYKIAQTQNSFSSIFCAISAYLGYNFKQLKKY